MLSFNEMIAAGPKFSWKKRQMNVEKYNAFWNYLKEVISITFKDEKEAIASYIDEMDECSFSLDWNVGGTHYIGFSICRMVDEIGIKTLRAHNEYSYHYLNLSDDDDKLLEFFNNDNEYLNFLNEFTAIDIGEIEKLDNSISYKIAKKLNEAIYKNFTEQFSMLGIFNYQDFVDSKYSLSFTDERRKELDEEIYNEYNMFCEEVKSLTDKFKESVKDLK